MLLQKHYSEEQNKQEFTVNIFACDMNKTSRTVKSQYVYCLNI